jgi:dTDP-4-amino-4,6-dideoxygalactose transaminase
MIIRFEKPTLRRKDMDAVLQTMVDEHIGPGQRTAQFVSLLQSITGIQGAAVALRSLPVALFHALRIAGVQPGDAVVTSALSPGMYASVAAMLGCRLLIGDIDEETGNLSYLEMQKLMVHKPKAVILYEPYGNFDFNRSWKDLGIPIIEDITESLCSSYQERASGRDCDIAVCAFEESGIVSTGGGAAILCESIAMQERLDALLGAEIVFQELPDMNAALGIVQISLVKQHMERRRAIFRIYQQALLHTRHHLFGIPDIDYDINGYGFTVVLDGRPEEAMQFALKYEVSIQRAFAQCLIQNELDRFDLYPKAIVCALRSVSFPLYPFLTNQQVAQIEKVISHLP